MSKIIIKTEEEIKILREGGLRLAKIMDILRSEIKVGYETKNLDKKVGELARQFDAEPSFRGYRGYPASVCLSINDEVVHCPPGDRIIKSGDVVSLDFGLKYKNLYTDTAITFGVGNLSDKAKKLIKVTEECLYKGIEQVKSGVKLGDVSFAIGKHAEENGFSLVRDLTGHGVGRAVHEPPQIFNFGVPGMGPVLKSGMVLAIEPMVNVGGWEIKTGTDGWSVMTADGELSAHFEHTVVVVRDGCEILTKYSNILIS